MMINDITENVIQAALSVHSATGAGPLEKAYGICLYHELVQRGLQFEHQVKVPVTYRGIRLDAGFRIDYLVENRVLVEIKSVEKLHPVHIAQVLNYLKLSGLTVGLLINFNVAHLRDGIHRLANNYVPESDI